MPVATTLAVVVLAIDVPGAGAVRNVAVTYACSTSLGTTLTAPAAVTGATPAKIAPGSKVSMTGFQAKVTIPASFVTELVDLLGLKNLSGELATFNIVSTNKASTVNAAGKGIKFGPLALTSGKGLTIGLPAKPTTVGSWTAGTKGTMTFRPGKLEMTANVQGTPLSLTCKPGHTVLSTTSVS